MISLLVSVWFSFSGAAIVFFLSGAVLADLKIILDCICLGVVGVCLVLDLFGVDPFRLGGDPEISVRFECLLPRDLAGFVVDVLGTNIDCLLGVSSCVGSLIPPSRNPAKSPGFDIAPMSCRAKFSASFAFCSWYAWSLLILWGFGDSSVKLFLHLIGYIRS